MSEWKMTHSAGVWHFVILKGFLSITVVKVGLDKFMVKIKFNQRLYLQGIITY